MKVGTKSALNSTFVSPHVTEPKMCGKFLCLHQTRLVILFVLLFTGGLTMPLHAENGTGPGLGLGGGSLSPINDTNGTEYHSSSVYASSFDYQWALSKSFSASLILQETGGEGTMPSKPEYKFYKSGIIGLQFKVWMGPLFLGLHGGQYYLTWIESMSAYSGIQQAGGNGYSIGFETSSGWFLAAFSDQSQTFTFDEMPDQRVEGNRVLLGYRWK